jgi:DNA-directed RNA polymerase subunit H (RpoH/RPB5)
MDEETLRKYYLSYSTMIKILKCQSYQVPLEYEKSHSQFCEEMEDVQTLNELKNKLSENMIFEKEGGKRVAVMWILDKKLGANIRDIVTDMESKSVNYGLIVADEGPTKQVGETIKSLKITKNIYISVWSLKSSMIFIPEHRLVPLQRICTKAEKKEVYAKYNIKGQQVPKMFLYDPIVSVLGAQKNDLIKIVRISESDPAKFMVSYRIVY